jgi:hypothetical protein
MCTGKEAYSFNESRRRAQAAAIRPYQNQAMGPYQSPSEEVMAKMFREDLGITIDPVALRMFIRARFDRLAPLAHRIHEGKP